MTISRLNDYDSWLHGCRFCPMCKPANETGQVLAVESYSTRSRAMFLWRKIHGQAEYTPRAVEHLFQGTLDTISQAWCVSRYPVGQYILAARREIEATGLLPQPVRAALERPGAVLEDGDGDTVFLGGEISEWGEPGLLDSVRARRTYGSPVRYLVHPTGSLPWVLGDVEGARRMATALQLRLAAMKPRRIVADGASTLWALRKLWPQLGLGLPEGCVTLSLAEWLAEGTDTQRSFSAGTALVHDARAAYWLADKEASSEVIKPEFEGPEELQGVGVLYDVPRKLVQTSGWTTAFSNWQRNLTKSSGADDGLWLTYPQIAVKMGRARLAHAREIGARAVITESPLAAAFLRQTSTSEPEPLPVYWLPEVV